MKSELLHKAISLSLSGQKIEARKLLKTYLKNQLDDETAWLWFVNTFSSDDERIKALNLMLKYKPNSRIATNGLRALKEKPSQSLASTQTNVSFVSQSNIQNKNNIFKSPVFLLGFTLVVVLVLTGIVFAMINISPGGKIIDVSQLEQIELGIKSYIDTTGNNSRVTYSSTENEILIIIAPTDLFVPFDHDVLLAGGDMMEATAWELYKPICEAVVLNRVPTKVKIIVDDKNELFDAVFSTDDCYLFNPVTTENISDLNAVIDWMGND